MKALSTTTLEQAELSERLRTSTSRVWAYIRVSSDKQEDGQSLDVQKQQILDFCAKNGLAVPELVFESASAAHPAIPISLNQRKPDAPQRTSPRPLVLMLLGFLSEHSGAHLVVWKLDRLARLSYEQELMIDLLTRKGVRIHSTWKGEEDILNRRDDDDPARVMFRQVLAAVAQYERSVIKIRMRTGIRMKASKGEWVGGNVPPGYVVKGGDLAVDDTMAETIRRIFYLRDMCSESLDRIAKRLDRDFKTPGWHKVRVSRVIHNKSLYSGVYTDPFGIPHERPDLKILPATWTTWAEQNNMAALEADRFDLPRLTNTTPTEAEDFPTYGE